MVIVFTGIAFAAFVPIVLTCLGASLQDSIIAGVAASALVWAIHVSDCLMYNPSFDFAWQYISGDILLIIVPIHLFGALIVSTVSAFVASLIREQG